MTERYLCSGPPGSGKTTVLQQLGSRFQIVPESARRVIAEQRASGGRGTSDQDQHLFVELMLKRSIADASANASNRSPILFDRGLPDLLAYATYFALDTSNILEAIKIYTYEKDVFWFPAWREIYARDDERTMSFEEAAGFGEQLREVYQSVGYRLVEMPRASIEDRAAFIRDRLA